MDGETTKRAARIRAAVKSLGKRGPGRRYPETLKREVLAYLAERRRRGRGLATTSSELGIPERSIKLWAGAPRAPSAPAFVTMAVTEERDPPASRIVVHAPGGVRIEGLDAASVADLLRRLA
jgi:transposase